MADVSTTHPDLTSDRAAAWRLMRDTAQGSGAVKARGTTYLPKPSGFNAMPDGGDAAYAAYTFRAIVPEMVAPSIAAMVGIIHAKETQIELPKAMEPMWEDADGDGMPLEAFHRKITRHLLLLGRYGVLTTAPAAGGDPYLVGYAGDAIINWDQDFYVLDETTYRRNGFKWSRVPRFRVLELIDGAVISSVYEGDILSAPVETIEPRARGGSRLAFVPFVVGNATEVSPAIQTPPLIGVADAVINGYQLSADWRYQLFMSGQETMVAINGDAPKIIGGGVVHQMMGGPNQQPDLKYVSPTCSGIEAHKTAIEDQRTAAVMAGARLFENRGSGQESGEARKLRFASETASLLSIAQVSASLLERSLRFAAEMRGLPSADIVVTPPRDLLDNTMSPADFAQLFNVYERGGMSWETYYENGQSGGIFSPERDSKQEYALLEGDELEIDGLLPRRDAATSAQDQTSDAQNGTR